MSLRFSNYEAYSLGLLPKKFSTANRVAERFYYFSLPSDIRIQQQNLSVVSALYSYLLTRYDSSHRQSTLITNTNLFTNPCAANLQHGGFLFSSHRPCIILSLPSLVTGLACDIKMISWSGSLGLGKSASLQPRPESIYLMRWSTAINKCLLRHGPLLLMMCSIYCTI